jgi:menaquinone-dependent protoporphyrinogen IX oxidase
MEVIMKTVVIYKSKTGFTKKYAEWISKDLAADIFDTSKANIDMLNTYDTVIYGGSLYAVGILGVKFITENLDKLKDKKLVVFATGASPWREEILNEVKNKNFTTEQQRSISFFYLRGGFDYSKLNLFDKFLMTLLRLKIKSKKELTSDEKSLLSMYDKPVDLTMKKNIDEIITYVNS